MKNSSKNHSIILTKGILFVFGLFFSSTFAYSQAGISQSVFTPNSSAGLDINFTSKGFLIPRIALANTASSTPLASHLAGMIIYNTTNNATLAPGLYYNNGARWLPFNPKAYSAGGMQYWDGSGWAQISPGQTGQVLQVNSSGVPAWSGAGYASMTTVQLSSITSGSAQSGGNISTDGGNTISARGVCWAITPDPTIADSKTVDGAGTGSFTSGLTGLTPGTLYYVRAYSTNSMGTSYGNMLIFSTL